MTAVPNESPDTLAMIERTLHERIGLDPSTVGSSLVHRAVHRRMKTIGLGTVTAYAHVLATDGQEMQELVEEVVIPETYFRRESEALDAVAQRVARGTPRATAESPVRVFSAPCSTGEEPYSIAMTLLAAGVSPAGVAIDAVDVSVNAVRRARAAVYRGGSFRGDMQPWQRYFDEAPQGFALRAEVKQLVRVGQGNLLDGEFRAPRTAYDYIFCRNLLIYFDAEAQARVLSTLTALLAPAGVLVVGAADSFAVRRAGFVPVPGAERSFLFQHRPSQVIDAFAATAPTRERRPRLANGVRATALPARAPKAKPATAVARRTKAAPAQQAPSIDTMTPLVAEIARLAGAGRLADAIRLGEGAMTATDASAALLSLMGTTFDAMKQDARAEACYRRALYLDPSHADALLHLALLLERKGDATAAARLRTRARRTLDAPGGNA